MSEQKARGDRPPDGDLAPRLRPVQRRAKKTVDSILDTAGELLEEVGIDAFNTNLLAQRAGVAVRSVYRYYPNKLAVIVGLAERQAHEWQESFSSLVLTMKDPNQSALDAWSHLLDGYVTYLEGKRGRSAIRRAMQALPRLREVNRDDNDELSRQIAGALRARGVAQSASLLRLVGRLLLETSDAAIDDALSRHGRVPKATLDEIKLMHRSYLALYAD
jgi:AcrR family transcriptional regulator